MTSNPVLTDAITWDAPDGEHPARRASQRSYAAVARGDLEGQGHRGHEGIRRFWAAAIAPIESFRFHVRDSHANPGSNTCANVGTITTTFPDGGVVDTDLVMVYTVHEDGRVASMRAFWEPERAMATYRKPE